MLLILTTFKIFSFVVREYPLILVICNGDYIQQPRGGDNIPDRDRTIKSRGVRAPNCISPVACRIGHIPVIPRDKCLEDMRYLYLLTGHYLYIYLGLDHFTVCP